MTKDYLDFLHCKVDDDNTNTTETESYGEFSFEYAMTGCICSKYNYSDEYYGCPLYSKYAEEWC